MQVFAFYLPQFHPIVENDEWWGKGFTEWTNVAAARPLFRKHAQPRTPADLGFYDLRLPEVMQSQAELAREYGIAAFTCWHYWFCGKRLLERPVNDVLADPKIQFPFNLAWANQLWSRRWLGEKTDVLQPQTYSRADDIVHARWLVHAFADQRYTKVGGRPIFSIYDPTDLPEPARTLDTIRTVASTSGLPDPYLLAINGLNPGADFHSLGFDGVIDFQPQLGALPLALSDGFDKRRLVRNLRRGVMSGRLKIYRDNEARLLMSEGRPDPRAHRSVFVSWDNSPRRGRDAIVVKDWSPSSFATAVCDARLATLAEHAPATQILWINAWNEWAEGNYLEPDKTDGRLKLTTLKNALTKQLNVREGCAESTCT
jgi:hypothetical protein